MGICFFCHLASPTLLPAQSPEVKWMEGRVHLHLPKSKESSHCPALTWQLKGSYVTAARPMRDPPESFPENELIGVPEKSLGFLPTGALSLAVQARGVSESRASRGNLGVPTGLLCFYLIFSKGFHPLPSTSRPISF